MTTIWALALFLTQASAQDTGDLARGAKVFAQSCAVGYCHGTAGAANRGPRLAGRGFDRPFVDGVIRNGVPGTAMPGFKSMAAPDLNAVIAYVMNISGGGAAAAPASTPIHVPSAEPPQFPGPPEAKKGKDLFFNPVRGTRCGTCHAVEDWGLAVGPNLAAKPPASASAIRDVRITGVSTAVTKDGEQFPALLVSRKMGQVQVYDLSAPPPVLRTFPASGITLRQGTAWSHANATQPYSDSDLTEIAAYLKWVATRP